MNKNEFLTISKDGEVYLRDIDLEKLKIEFIHSEDLIRYLDLRNNSLSSLPPFLLSLKNLISLDLRENSLEMIPDSISLLTLLQVLKLDYNHLSSLPLSLFTINSLKSMSFSHNSLTALDKSIGNLTSLLFLDISCNQIQSLPRSIKKLVSLNSLDLHSNEFSRLPAILHFLTSLKSFSLEWLRYTQPSLPITLKGLNGEMLIRSLQKLSLINYSQSAHSVITIIQFLHHFTESSISLQTCGYGGTTLMHKAVLHNEIGVVKGLLESGFDLDLLDQDGYSCLVLAIREDNLQIARMLIEAGCNTNIGGGIYGSALHLAVAKNEVWLVTSLIKSGCRVDQRNSDGNTVIHVLMINFKKHKQHSQGIGELLLTAGIDPNLHNKDNWAAIHIASRKAQNTALKWIFYINSSKVFKHCRFIIDIPGGKQDWTALHLASHAGLFKTTRLLLKAGSDIFCANRLGKTAKDVAKGNLSLFKFLGAIERYHLKEFVKNNRIAELEGSAADDGYEKAYLGFRGRDIEGIKEAAVIENGDKKFMVEADCVYLIGRVIEKYPKEYLKTVAKTGNTLAQREAILALKEIKALESQIISPRNIIGPRVSIGSQICKIKRKDSDTPED